MTMEGDSCSDPSIVIVAHQSLAEKYLKKYTNFLEIHSRQLQDLLLQVPQLQADDVHGLDDNEDNDDQKVSSSSKNTNSRDRHKSTSSISLSGRVSKNGHLGGPVLFTPTDPIEIRWSTGSCHQEDESVYEEILSRIPNMVLHGDIKNPEVEKVLLVLVTITNSLVKIKDRAKSQFYDQILLYGEGILDDTVNSSSLTSTQSQGQQQHQTDSTSIEGAGLLAISSFLPVLRELEEFLAKCQPLLVHLLRQLGSLFKDSRPQVVSIVGLQLPTVFREFSNVLASLTILDEILVSQSLLQDHWGTYKRMIKSVRADSKTFDVESSSLAALEKELDRLELRLLSGKIFWNMVKEVVHECWTISNGIQKNVPLCERFIEQITLMTQNLEKNFNDGFDVQRSISLVTLFAFSTHLYSKNTSSNMFDVKKIFTKTIWEPLKRIPCIYIGGCLLWSPEKFLDTIPNWEQGKLLDMKSIRAQQSFKISYLQQRMQRLPMEVLGNHIHISAWSSRLQEGLLSKDLSTLLLSDLSRRSLNLIEGVKFAQILSQSFRLLLNLHHELERPLSVHSVGLICQILEQLKEIQSIFQRFNVQITASAMLIVQHVQHIALSHIKALQNGLVSASQLSSLNTTISLKNYDEARTDTLSALFVLDNALRHGPPSPCRLLLAKLALEWVITSSTRLKVRLTSLEESHLIPLSAALERIRILMDLTDRIKNLTNGSSLYWHRSLLSNYFTSVFNSPHESLKLPKMFLIIGDCLRLVEKSSPHGEQSKCAFITEVGQYLQNNLIEKIWRDVETELRLQSHAHLQQVEIGGGGDSGAEANLFSRSGGAKYLVELVNSPSILFDDKKINIKYLTEYYLSKTFYNLASVALHDWQTYATMRALAMDKYQLKIAEDHLPGHTIEQGMDILGIVRNLNKFVAEFSYNLNNQVFVQITSPNKHLDTVNIRHLANSMRTHGSGIANNTVNCTYHFLRVKIHPFSQFLFDEQIKSRLTKDIRLFKQGRQIQSDQPSSSSSTSTTNSNSMNNYFPYDRALKFQRGIRKLGLSPEGLSPLDQFRVLITQIGNALGFVRLVRSGGLHFLAAGCRFLPDIDDIPKFDELDGGAEIMTMTTTMPLTKRELNDSTASIDATLSTLSSSFSGGVAYFKLLVSAFSSALREPRNAHLKNFYVIIPSLSLSYIEHIRSCKEKLAKKTKGWTIFTDDGFAMGVAYLLRVLDQDGDFDSLQWFEGVRETLRDELTREKKIVAEAKKDEKQQLEQTSQLTVKRVQDILHEFELLQYNLSSARIFFQQHKSF